MCTINTNNSSKSSQSSQTKPLVSFLARPKGSRCPFGNEISFQICPGDCVWLQGNSGRGKTTLAMHLCGNHLLSPSLLDRLDIEATCEWDSSISKSQRCGVLFQQTTLLDELTVGGNLAAALHAVSCPSSEIQSRIKGLLDLVGLDFAKDAGKRPTELSGGMSRRASLALQLAQNKHIIFLDEPFTGLDEDVAISIAKELVHLRKTQGTAFILISHEYEYAKRVLAPDCKGNLIVKLDGPKQALNAEKSRSKANLYFGTRFSHRFCQRLLDYFFWSLPLILLAFSAAGLAISMLTCDTLQRIDVSTPVLNIVDKEIRPLIKMLTGQEATTLHLLGVKFKVSGMLNETIPPAKATLYAMGLAKLFALEIGPLLTALLLCGRIGGSYAGKVATLQATSQVKLLKTLGISSILWTLLPSICAGLIAGPTLTCLGTLIALTAAGKVGVSYKISSEEKYRETVLDTLLPNVPWQNRPISSLDWVEVFTYPPIFHLVKALTFMCIILGVAEVCARTRPNLTPRGVPMVITQSVVSAGLLVILADWGFSRLWLQRN